ncbi:MAG: serine/threonine-protein kinase [Clostridiaceae bacterium]|nr:serine/threonine-protein kinase [Clostridiaceae bacterium]
MQIDTELRLSYYKELTDINKHHHVKLVQHIENGRIFVLKTLSVYDIRVFRYLFENPFQGIPHINELIEDNNLLYVVEEYISGISLQEKINMEGTIEEAEAVGYVKQLCRILRPLHKSNPPIVHRDIKPSNLIITMDNKLILVDFNSAKESNESQTQDTVLIGTVGYAAPEQYGFSSSKPTADIYAIGVLLNGMLTGHLPNEQIHTGKLQPIIMKCLQMDPAKRYKSIDELLRAISIKNTAFGGALQKTAAWLPPGLRSKNPWVAVPSSLWYIFIADISFSLKLENTFGAELQMNRIFLFIIFLSETLWLGNYQNIWRFMPITKSKKLFLKISGICIWSIVFVLTPLIILMLLS